MKKSTKLLIVLCSVAATFSAFTACKLSPSDSGSNTSVSSSGGQVADIAAPDGLKLKNAKLSWNAEAGVSYEVSVDGTTWIAVEEDEVNLLDVVTDVSVTKISVRGYQGDAKGQIAEYPITVVKLGTPGKPTYVFDEASKQRRLVWEEVEGADKYEVLVTTDGVASSKWVTYTTNYYAPTKTGTYTIEVRCKGYSEDDTLYIPGDKSPVSDTIEMLAVPVLQVPSVNRILWRSETEFDSYNLLITDKAGVTTKIENVRLSGPDLDLVQAGYITRTGEYNLQIEGVKNGESYYSNTYVEFGTTNINEKEFYSFDNRKANMTNAQAGLTVSDEEYYGKETGVPGYSLKINGADDSVTGQFNLVKYVGSGVNDILPSNITKLSYQIFVPAGQTDANGNEITSLRYTDLPAWRYEAVVGEPGVDAMAGYTISMFYDDTKTESYAVGQWHKIEITGENLNNDSVVIISCPFFKSNGIVAYIDEICYEGYEDRSSITKAEENMATVCPDATHVMSVSRGTIAVKAWQDGDRIAFDFGVENAGKTVDITYKAKGTATNWPEAGFVLLTEARGNDEKAGADDNGNGIAGENYVHSINGSISAFGQMENWETLTLKKVTLNSLGKVWLDGFANFKGEVKPDCTVADEFNVYFKDVQILREYPEHDAVGYNHAGQPNDSAKNIGIKLGLSKNYYYHTTNPEKAGVVEWTNVTMKIMGNLPADFAGTVGFACYGWAVNNGFPADTQTYCLSGNLLAAFKSNEYVEVTLRVPHYYDTAGYLVPVANGYTSPLEVFVKDIEIDYATISEFAEWPEGNAIQVKKNGDAAIDVYVKGTYDKVQLVVNGNVVQEDVVTGTIDMSSYLVAGSYTVKFVGVIGETTVESAELTYAVSPEGTEYTAFYGGTYTADKERNQAAEIEVDQSKFFQTTNPDRAGRAQWVTVTMKVQGTLDTTGWGETDFASFFCYGWAIDNGKPGSGQVYLDDAIAFTNAVSGSEWTEVTLRIPHFYDTKFILVPISNRTSYGAFYIFIKDVVIDYTTVSTIGKVDADTKVQIAKLGESTVDTYFKGTYNSIQLKINGEIVKEDVTADLIAGSLDISSYIVAGSYEVSLVAVNGEGSYESNVLTYMLIPDGTEYTSFYGGVATNDTTGNQAAEIEVDQSKFFKTTNPDRVGRAQWVTVTMKVQGTLDTTGWGEKDYASFFCYGWAINNGTPGNGQVYLDDEIAFTNAVSGSEWTEVTLRIPHFYDTKFILVPISNRTSYGAFYIFIKDVVIDYTTVSTIGDVDADTKVQIAKLGESTVDTYFKGTYDSIQLKINGEIVKEDVTADLVAGSLDISSYLVAGSYEVSLVAVNGDGSYESNALTYMLIPEDATDYAYNAGTLSDSSNKMINLHLDQSYFKGDATIEWVNVSMKMMGTLVVLEEQSNSAIVFYTYGWALGQGDFWKNNIVNVGVNKYSSAFSSSEWVDVVIRVPHYYDVSGLLIPLTSWSQGAFYVFVKDIVVDYSTVTTSPDSPILTMVTKGGNVASDKSNAVPKITVDQSYYYCTTDSSKVGTMQWTNMTLKLRGNLPADFTGGVGFMCYGWGIDNGLRTSATLISDVATVRTAMQSSEWTEICIRFPKYYDTNLYLVPITATALEQDLVCEIMVVEIDYSTITESSSSPIATTITKNGNVASDTSNTAARIAIDQSYYYCTTDSSKVGTMQWTTMTLKIRGNLSADFAGAVGFMCYGWAVNNGLSTSATLITDMATIRTAMQGSEWTEIQIRFPKYYDTNLYLVPITSSDLGQDLVCEIVVVDIDYTTISESAS